MDSDGPEPLATVGQLSSPRFASFFEPSLCTRGDPLRRLRRPTSIYEQRFSTAILPSLSLRTLVCVTRLPFSRQTHLELECVYMCVCSATGGSALVVETKDETRIIRHTVWRLDAGKPSLSYLFIREERERYQQRETRFPFFPKTKEVETWIETTKLRRLSPHISQRRSTTSKRFKIKTLKSN